MANFTSEYATKLLQKSSENKNVFKRAENRPTKNTNDIPIKYKVKERSKPDPISAPLGENY